MVIYHFTWDLGFYRLSSIQAGVDPGWRLFAKLIAGSFLFLAGVGLVLAHGDGIQWRAFWRRFGILAAAAAAISLATWLAMPEGFIFFGILHSIAICSLLSLPFVRAPFWLALAAAAAVFALPAFFRSTVFDSPFWYWLGLSQSLPLTNDYEPVLPWLGPMLLGVAFGRIAMTLGWDAVLAAFPAKSPPARGLAFAGRNSLLVYLGHQPVLLSALWVVAMLAGPAQVRPGAGEGLEFQPSCRRTCVSGGSSVEFCEATCACVADKLAGSPVLKRNDLATVPEAERRQLNEAVKACIPPQE